MITKGKQGVNQNLNHFPQTAILKSTLLPLNMLYMCHLSNFRFLSCISFPFILTQFFAVGKMFDVLTML